MARDRPGSTEFGGVDTTKTLGIQPAPHQLTPDEQLRVWHSIDAMRADGDEPIPGLEPL